MRKLSLLEVLEGLEDNRRELSVWYPPHEVLFILLTAVICGATSYAKVETFGHLREKWLTSLTDAHMFADAVRKHWSIENQLHWQLDVTFGGGDSARARKDNSPLNLNILRKQALALLNSADMGKRVSLRRKMSRAAMDNEKLRRVVFPEK